MKIFIDGCFLMNFQNRFRIWLEGPWRSSVFINLKKLALASMLSLKFLPRPLWRSMFSLKLESYSLPHCKKNCHMLDFLSIFWTATFKNDVWRATFPWTKAVSRRVSVNKVLFTDFAKFIGKHLCWSLLFIKIAGLGVFLWTWTKDFKLENMS